MAAMFSEKQKKKVFELREKGLSAQEIADRINKMACFEDDPEMGASSVWGIVYRYRNGNGKGQSSNGTRKPPCYVKEYLTTIKDGDVVVLTISLPREKLGHVQRQLGIFE